MNEIGDVTSTEGSDAPRVAVQLTEADHGEGDLFAPSGTDAPPLPGDKALCCIVTDGSGEFAVVAVAAASSKAAPGEHRIFARNGDGRLMAEVWAKGDGSVLIVADPDGPTPAVFTLEADGAVSLSNLAASFSISPAGAVELANHFGGVKLAETGAVDINGATISLAGGVKTLIGNDLDTHTHLSTLPATPTGPPIPVPTP